MKILKHSFSMLILLSMVQTGHAASKKDAEVIFDVLISPTMIAANDYLQTELSKKPELQKGVNFLQKIDFNKTILNSRKDVVTMIEKELTKNESSYYANYLSQPEVKKYYDIALKNKSFETAMSMLTDAEQAVVADKDYALETSIAPKFNTINLKLKSLISYKTIEEMEKIKDEIESMGSIDDGCNKAYESEIYNSSFLICGLGHKLKYKESSKVFAKMNWRGDFLERDIPKALEIYSQLLRKEIDPEVSFYYGVLNYNMSHDEKTKRTAACWINLAATKQYGPALEFYDDIKENFSDLPTKCSFISTK
jgi:hypothetical protein